VVDYVIILAVLAVFAVLATFFGWLSFRRLLAVAARSAMMPDTVLEAAFRGRLSTTLVHADAQLDLFDWGIRLHSTWRLFRRLVPVWEACYTDLATVQLIQGFGGYGVRLESNAGTGAVVLWTRRYDEVMDRLANHEVPVDRQMKSLKRAGGLSGRTG
jgi:hypothetical protein